MTILDDYESADAAFKTKAVLSQDSGTLLNHLHGLSNQNNTNTGTQHRDIIRGITINNILLQRHINSLQNHITTLDTKNSKLQKLVIVLTIAAVIGTLAQTIGTGIQTYIAVKQYSPTAQQSQPIASPSQMLEMQSATPIHAEPLSSGQAKKKAP